MNIIKYNHGHIDLDDFTLTRQTQPTPTLSGYKYNQYFHHKADKSLQLMVTIIKDDRPRPVRKERYEYSLTRLMTGTGGKI